MSTYDARLVALEKEVAVMKQDIIYKLDETNSALTIFKGVIGDQGLDLKVVIDRVRDIAVRVRGIGNQVEGIEVRLARSELQLEGLTQEVATIKEQQGVQGQGIKDIKHRLDGIDQRFEKVDQRFTSLEEKVDQRFDQVLQVLAALTNKP